MTRNGDLFLWWTIQHQCGCTYLRPVIATDMPPEARDSKRVLWQWGNCKRCQSREDALQYAAERKRKKAERLVIERGTVLVVTE